MSSLCGIDITNRLFKSQVLLYLSFLITDRWDADIDTSIPLTVIAVKNEFLVKNKKRSLSCGQKSRTKMIMLMRKLVQSYRSVSVMNKV